MRITRRVFCGAAFAGLAGCARGARAAEAVEKPPFPLVDLHVHLDNSTVDQVLALSAGRGVKFGIVEHAGTKENVYPVVLSSDQELVRQDFPQEMTVRRRKCFVFGGFCLQGSGLGKILGDVPES